MVSNDSIAPPREVTVLSDADRSGFRRLTAAHFLSYASYTALTPLLAVYFVSLGFDAVFVGLTVAAFSIVSIIVRPLAGALVDRQERSRVYAASAGLMGLSTFGYLMPVVPAILAARISQGGAWAVLNTAAPAMAVDLAPDSQRARSIGILNMGRSLALPVSPAIGLWIAATFGFGWALSIAAIVGVIAMYVALGVRSGPRAAPAPRPAGSSRLSALIVPSALLPAAIQSLLYAGAPLLFTFLPLYAASIGVADVGLVYVASGITMILVQPLARLSDRFGRVPSIAAGLTFATAGLFAFTVADGLPGLAVAGALWATGAALVEPAATALVIDRAIPDRRGAALATYTAAFQVGNAFGATAWGALIVTQGYRAAFLAGAGVTSLALALTVASAWGPRRSR